ncbi:hypothetical protein [Streptomyces sp. NBC_01465]|uniref:hypothetical protein n=1 Tax=Streptomyces sp. NBC_01465 TaxID=2903878 RepID=UPI002E316002|nr:hypothetical protein [Streptomyces sp. NBC_01465]
MGAIGVFILGTAVVVAGLLALVGRRGRSSRTENPDAYAIEKRAVLEAQRIHDEVRSLHAQSDISGTFGHSRLTRRR